MPELIPAILVKDAETFRARLKLMEGLVGTVQLDCMDGHFVDNRTWYEAMPVDSTLEIELHLMVSDPLAVIEDWKRVKNVIRAIWHVEIPVDHEKIITRCRELGWDCGLAISPETPMTRLAPLAELVDEILVLGVNPGWSGQALIPSTLVKADDIKQRWPDLEVGFDGGLTRENLQNIKSHQIDRLCVASAIFNDPDPRSAAHAILASI
jgi:ribulose-phosphate 3-epimerase